MNWLRVSPMAGRPDTRPVTKLPTMDPRPSKILRITPMPLSIKSPPPKASKSACILPSAKSTNPMAPTNAANVMQPFSITPGDAIFDAKATIVKAPDNARSNSDILPTVSIDVLKPKVVSSADMPTTSAPRAATTPTIIHI